MRGPCRPAWSAQHATLDPAPQSRDRLMPVRRQTPRRQARRQRAQRARRYATRTRRMPWPPWLLRPLQSPVAGSWRSQHAEAAAWVCWRQGTQTAMASWQTRLVPFVAVRQCRIRRRRRRRACGSARCASVLLAPLRPLPRAVSLPSLAAPCRRDWFGMDEGARVLCVHADPAWPGAGACVAGHESEAQ